MNTPKPFFHLLTERHYRDFWAKVRFERVDGCWEWQGTIGNRRDQMMGYGVFYIAARPYLAHRVAYTMFHKKDLGNLFARHKCDNPRCVNFSHIIPGTHLDNMRDKVERGRQATGDKINKAKRVTGDKHWMRMYPERVSRGTEHYAHIHPEIRQGENNGRSKITAQDVIRLRELFNETELKRWVFCKKVAPDFGLSPGSVENILLRKTWPNIV